MRRLLGLGAKVVRNGMGSVLVLYFFVFLLDTLRCPIFDRATQIYNPEDQTGKGPPDTENNKMTLQMAILNNCGKKGMFHILSAHACTIIQSSMREISYTYQCNENKLKHLAAELIEVYSQHKPNKSL